MGGGVAVPETGRRPAGRLQLRGERREHSMRPLSKVGVRTQTWWVMLRLEGLACFGEKIPMKMLS